MLFLQIKVVIHSFSVAFLVSLAHEWDLSRSYRYSATSGRTVRQMFNKLVQIVLLTRCSSVSLVFFSNIGLEHSWFLISVRDRKSVV